MKAKYGGPMSVDDFYQALWQDRQFFTTHAITHVRAVYVYFTPCDEYGQPVTVCDPLGNIIEGFNSAGAYHCAADAYDRAAAQDLTPKPVTRPSPASMPFSPV